MNLSINNNNKLMENMKRTNVRLPKEKSEVQTTVKQESISAYGDTVEITLSGKDVNEDADRSDNVIESKDGKVTRISVETDTNTETSSQTYNLSVYSERELKQMYQSGEITKTEYDEELNSRE